MSADSIPWQSREYDFPLKLRYRMIPAGRPFCISGATVVLLHGYQDHSMALLKRLGWHDDPKLPFNVLAIDGPFPAPIWKDIGFIEAYSWYFRDAAGKAVLVAPETTSERVGQLVTDLGLQSKAKLILGFSQGGYFAPHVAKHLLDLKGILAIGSGYPFEAYQRLANGLRVEGVHGARDERVDPIKAEADHKKIVEHGARGSFHLIPDIRHKIEPSVGPLVLDLCTQIFKDDFGGGRP